MWTVADEKRYEVLNQDAKIATRNGERLFGWETASEILKVWGGQIIMHAGYPHNPGYLHDCPACDAACHCSSRVPASETECVFEGEHNPGYNAD